MEERGRWNSSTSLRIACIRAPRRPTAAPAPAEGWSRLAGALLEVAPRVSPIVDAVPRDTGADAGSRGAWADVSGMERRGGDAALARALLDAAREVGFAEARVGVAGTCIAAALATRERGSPWRIVPPGRDADFVGRRPLAWLPLEPELLRSLELLGLRACGELARLPAADVELRFGAEGLRAWRMARGEDARWPFRPPSPQGVSAEVELDSPVESSEPLLFLVRGLVASVVGQMARRQRVPAALRLALLLCDGEEALPVRPARPTADERVLVDLCRRALEGHAAAGPVAGMRLEGLEEGVARADQLDIFAPPAPDPAAVHGALLPLLSRWGDRALSRAAPRGAHLPAEQAVWDTEGARGIQALARAPASRGAAPVPTAAGPRPDLYLCLRRFPAPRPARVERDAAGRPTTLRFTGRAGAFERVPVRAEGPERLSGRWWSDGYAREYWLVEGEDGRLWLLYHDALRERWYVEGWYD